MPTVPGGVETERSLVHFVSGMRWGWVSLRSVKWRYLPSIERTVAPCVRACIPGENPFLWRLWLLTGAAWGYSWLWSWTCHQTNPESLWFRPTTEGVLKVYLGPRKYARIFSLWGWKETASEFWYSRSHRDISRQPSEAWAWATVGEVSKVPWTCLAYKFFCIYSWCLGRGL